MWSLWDFGIFVSAVNLFNSDYWIVFLKSCGSGPHVYGRLCYWQWFRVCHIEWSKFKRERAILHINAYTWNLDQTCELRVGERRVGPTGRLGLTYIHYAAAAKLLQPSRLLHPWDSLGKNTGVGCHFFLQCMLSRFSHIQLCAAPWTAAHQAPLSTGFSRQEYWSGLPFPSPVRYAAMSEIGN